MIMYKSPKINVFREKNKFLDSMAGPIFTATNGKGYIESREGTSGKPKDLSKYIDKGLIAGGYFKSTKRGWTWKEWEPKLAYGKYFRVYLRKGQSVALRGLMLMTTITGNLKDNGGYQCLDGKWERIMPGRPIGYGNYKPLPNESVKFNDGPDTWRKK